MSSSPPPPPSCLLAFDFDGTLVHEEFSPLIVDEFLEIMDALREQNARWAINTGRGLFHCLQGMADHGLRRLPDFLIVKERELYQPGRFHRWVPLGPWNERCEKAHRVFFKSIRKSLKKVRKFIESETGASYIEEKDEPAGIVARSDEEMDGIVAYLDGFKTEHPELHYERNSIYLRIAHRAYNKGSTLSHLASLLEVPTERVFAVGDNHNDLTMLHPDCAGMIACPGNAVSEVRHQVTAHGGFVASRGAGLGVVEALRHYFR
ncbi:MAG: HAD hydrolase family protein [Verrucomicrobiota bacterium]